MMSRPIAAWALMAAASLAQPAFAHGVAGPRVFVNTLLIDDPAVADEASLPTFSWQLPPGAAPANQYDFDFEYDKRITERFGFALNDGYTLQTMPGVKNASGWQNLFLTLKYQAYLNAEHETLVSVGVIREFARTGSDDIGNDDVGTTTPTLYWGKGLGDLPIGWFRPFAITGTFGYQIADKELKSISAPEPTPGLMGALFNNGLENRWVGGLSVQYSIPYLQSQVRDLGLPDFIGHLTPLVEVAWSSPASHPHATGTQYLIGAGAFYVADTYGVGLEALIPGNGQTGRADRSDRAAPPLFRRPVPEQSRQAADRMVIQMIRFLPTAPAIAVATILGIPPAFAHAFLTRAIPAVGSTVATSPPVLTLFFTEGVVPHFSKVQVLDARGLPVSAGEPRAATDNGRELLVGLPKLPPGSYTVVWHVTSQDTHKTEGRFSFKIAP